MFCCNCGKEIDNGALYCVFCGSKQTKLLNKNNEKNIIEDVSINDTIIKNEEVNREILENKKENFNDNNIKEKYKNLHCPYCESDNIQKFSLVYLNGIGKIDGTTVGVGTNGIYGGLVNGNTQTALSEITAPPKKKWVIRRYFLMSMLMSIVVSIIMTSKIDDFIWFNTIIMIVLCWIVPICYAIRGHFYNSKIYKKLYYMWDKKFLCLRCSQWFYLDNEKYNLLNEESIIKEKELYWKKSGKILVVGILFVIIVFYIVEFVDKKISGSWSTDSMGTYYINPNGKSESDKLIVYHGENYYIQDDGTKLVKSWKEIDSELYYFDENGKMEKNIWIKYYGKRYHLGQSGKLDRNKWIGEYYVGEDGKIVVNTITPDGKKVDSYGKVIK